MPETADVLKDKLSVIHESTSDPSQKHSSVHSLLEDATVDLLNIVGHDREHIFVNVDFETPRRVKQELGTDLINFSAIAAESVSSPPHVAVAVITRRMFMDLSEPTPLEGWLGQHLLGYRVTARAECTAILTPDALAVLGTSYPGVAYPLSNFSKEHANEVIELLEPPEEYPEGKTGKFPAGHHPDQTKLTRWLFGDSELTPEYTSEIDTDFFQLDIDDYSEMLYDAYSAESNQEKGDLLEDVTEFLFEGLSVLEVRDRNLRSKSDEIDLVLEYVGGPEPNLFEYHSRFIIIECKNVGSSVSSKEVSHFDTKISRTGCDIGILIAWTGISGAETGDNAQRYVDTSLDSNIVVLTSDDLYRILDGESLYKIIDEKMYALRFDL